MVFKSTAHNIVDKRHVARASDKHRLVGRSLSCGFPAAAAFHYAAVSLHYAAVAFHYAAVALHYAATALHYAAVALHYDIF